MNEEQLKEFGEYLLLTKGLGDSTVEDYLSWGRKFEVENLTQEYIDGFAQRHGNNSNVRGFILNFIEFAGLKKVFDMPPKQTGRKKKRIVRDVVKEEIDRLRVHFYDLAFHKGLLFDLLYQGALRRSEVVTIKINSFMWLDWLDDQSKFCKLAVVGKGDKERIVLVNPETAEAIMEHYHKKYMLYDADRIMEFVNSPNLLFRGRFGAPLSQNRIYKMINHASKRVLNRAIRPHELRHARATELERRGVSVQDIKNYLGHASLSTTELYLHRSEKESIENIEEQLTKGAK